MEVMYGSPYRYLYYKTVLVPVSYTHLYRKNLRKFIFKMNTSEKERDNKISAISSIVDIPMTYLVNELENKVLKVGEDLSLIHI